jgi:hypothetical protein
MSIVYLICFIVAILLGVRIMFFGAERRRYSGQGVPLRKSEPAFVAFLGAFGLVGYLLQRNTTVAGWAVALWAVLVGLLWSGVVVRLAIATARIQPEVDPDDPRFVLQGCVATVVSPINPAEEGLIQFEERGSRRSCAARNIGAGVIAAGEEVCIERIEDGVAYVERWALVEARL